ncbi:T9SS type A sorting domain-containing protein [Empedobacter tilapiae]
MKKIFTLLTATLFSYSFAQMVLNTKIEQKIENQNRSIAELNKKSSKKIVDNSAFGFEAKEGFKLGSVDSQNYWYSAEDSDGYIYNNQFIVNDVNYEGSQSLALAIDVQYPEQIDQGKVIATIGAYYNKASLSSDNVEFVIMPIMDNKTMYQISVSDYTNKYYRDQITIFSDDKTMYISDFNINKFVSTGIKVSTNTWYKVKIEYTNNKVNYYIDGKNVYSRNSSGVSDQIADYIDFMHSNSTSSTKLRIDNVILGNGSLNTNDMNKESIIKVYPNPVSDFVKINNLSSEKIESITIGDLTGRTVKYVDRKSSTIDVQSLPNGVYLLKIKTDKGMKIEKIIKK